MSSSASSAAQLRAAFGFGFAHRLVPRAGAACGVFDPSGREQLAVGTDTGKVCLQGTEAMFNISGKITCVGVYPRLQMGVDQFDAVLVGTGTSLMALDVFNNKTLFHRDMPEGVNCIRVGHVDEHRQAPVIICGCGTTIWGFRLDGTDVFWTALGDQVNALELCDMDGDGQNELIVGTDGIDIKVLKNASFFAEFDEGDPAVALCSLRPATFAFGLASGVVGVYGQGERLWRVKTKSQIVALLAFPDAAHVACVWQGAKIDIRAAPTGEIRSKEQLDGGELSAAFLADLAGAGPLDSGEPQPQLTLVFRNGQDELESVYRNGQGQVRSLELRTEPGAPDDGAQLREISQRKHALLEELKTYERRGSQAASEAGAEAPVVERSLVPPGTTLSCVLDLSSGAEALLNTAGTSGGLGVPACPGGGPRASIVSVPGARGGGAAGDSLCLRLALTNDVPIRAVLLFAEGIFDSECFAIHPNGKESAEMMVQFSPAKNVLAELFIKVFAGYSIDYFGRQLRVFECNQVLPRFVTFVHVDQLPGDSPVSFVSFRWLPRPDQLRQWMAENFVFVDEEGMFGEGGGGEEAGTGEEGKKEEKREKGRWRARFVNTRNQEGMELEMNTESGETELRHNDIQNVADIVQSMCANMGIRELQCRAHFPHLLAVQSAVESMDDRYQVNERLASELAERLNVVRECVVRAEDALATRNFTEARRLYTRVMALNRELAGHQTIRMAARKELLDAVKHLNLSIDQFARLRVGAPAAELIRECRKAIADDRLELVPKLLEFGV